MARKRREKGYWAKRKELFMDGTSARVRAGTLRLHDGDKVSHVKMAREEDGYLVTYSVAKEWLAEYEKAGNKL